MPQWLRNLLMVLVSALWVANYAYHLIVHSYDPPAEINAAFTGVLGILAAGYRKSGDHSESTEHTATRKAAKVAPTRKSARRGA